MEKHLIAFCAVIFCLIFRVQCQLFQNERKKQAWGTRTGRTFLNLVCDLGSSEYVQQSRLDCVLTKGPMELKVILEACFYNTTGNIRSFEVISRLCHNEDTMKKLNTCFTMSEVPGLRPTLPPFYPNYIAHQNTLNYEKNPLKMNDENIENEIQRISEDDDIERNLVKRQLPRGLNPNPPPGWFLPTYQTRPWFHPMAMGSPPMRRIPHRNSGFDPMTMMRTQFRQRSEIGRRLPLKLRPIDVFPPPSTMEETDMYRNRDLMGRRQRPEPRHDAFTELIMMCERENPKNYYHT